MGEIKVTTWMLFICAVIALVLLISGPLGYKAGVVALGQAMGSTLVAFLLADVILIAALVIIVRSSPEGINRNLIAASFVICLIPAAVMGSQIARALSVPPIHDITTDTANPPAFDQIVEIRRFMPNPLTYGTEDMPAEKLMALQKENYPNIQSLTLQASLDEALSNAEAVMEEMGIEVVSRNDTLGIVEGTAQTFWFGFKDDVVVRVSERDNDCLIDVRSVSRVGQSDLGANAKRIESMLEKLSR